MDKEKERQETDEREQFVLDFMDICTNNGCDMIKIGGALYDAGYRKTDEARARDFLNALIKVVKEDNDKVVECDYEEYHIAVWRKG